MSFRVDLPLRRALIVAAAAALVASCASTPTTPEAAVTARANARWKAYIAGNFEQAYAYLSPASRALTPFSTWRGSIRGFTTWKSAEVVSVTCETSDKCVARVKVEHQPLILRGRLGTIDSGVDETWLFDEGQWWLLQTP